MNVAVTFLIWLAVPVTLHSRPLAPPTSQPFQLTKRDSLSGEAFRTTVPAGKSAEQVGSHSIPAGLETTVPSPVPALMTLRVNSDPSVPNLPIADGVPIDVYQRVPLGPAASVFAFEDD